MATATPRDSEAEPPIVGSFEHYEVIDDRVVDDPYLGAYQGWVASRLVRGMYFDETSDRGGFIMQGALFVLARSPRRWRRAHIAFVSHERWPARRPIPREEAWDVVPDLAVEIISPTDLVGDLMDKLAQYFEAGVRLVWVIYPDYRKVYVHDSPTSIRIFQVGDELEGGAVLPSFRFPLARLFERTKDGPTQ